MEVSAVSYNPEDKSLTVTFDPADNNPAEAALLQMSYIFLSLYPPPDQNKAAQGIRMVANALGFSLTLPDGDSVASITVQAHSGAKQ